MGIGAAVLRLRMAENDRVVIGSGAHMRLPVTRRRPAGGGRGEHAATI